MSIGAIVIALPQQVKADNQNGNNGVLAVTATYTLTVATVAMPTVAATM